MARSKVRSTWRIDEVVAVTRKETEQRVLRAAIFVRDEIKRSLNIGNAGGDEPSAVGEPPRKVTGRLQGSITEEVVVERNTVTGRVGTNVEYAPRLEHGFKGTDSAGRAIDQGARPFMKPGLFNNLERVRKIMGAKK
jgi:hypothetical protein